MRESEEKTIPIDPEYCSVQATVSHKHLSAPQTSKARRTGRVPDPGYLSWARLHLLSFTNALSTTETSSSFFPRTPDTVNRSDCSPS